MNAAARGIPPKVRPITPLEDEAPVPSWNSTMGVFIWANVTKNRFDNAPVRYDGQWPSQFTLLSREIKNTCVPYKAIESLDHIGSTAIAGLTAKPILDVLIELKPGAKYAEQLSRTLSGIGFTAKGENGISERLYFTRPLTESMPAVHIHAFVSGHEELIKHRAFRDFVRAHPKVTNEYSVLKNRILAMADITRETYQEMKAEFLQSTTRLAHEWYARHDLKEGRKRKPKKKVVVYVTRTNSKGETELLVFDQPLGDYGNINPQVPSGSVDKKEEIPLAAERELLEEAGIQLELTPLGSYVYYKPHLDRFQDRHHFLGHDAVRKTKLPETWTHSVTGGGNDKNLVFNFYWITIAEARERLQAGQERGLEYFNLR
ncbi:hypothetical protein BH10BDE1_BH10BDE1_33670 [soil metagenome]